MDGILQEWISMSGLRLTHLGGQGEFKALQDHHKEPKFVLANATEIVTLLYVTQKGSTGGQTDNCCLI